jgi:hypothetical protein
MKTVNKQQLVILMLIVISATMMTVTIMTTQMAKAEIPDGGVLGGLRDGQAQAENDQCAGVDNNNCNPARLPSSSEPIHGPVPGTASP